MRRGKQLVKEAERLGFTDVSVVRRSKHPQLVAKLNGVPYTQMFGGSPSDHRAFMNDRAFLRRQHRALIGAQN